jgi:ADP-ribose pyrophosphatase YjhB (NUDIX family)
MALSPGLLARGPWTPAQVEAAWTDEPWRAPPELERGADEAVAALRERGSPAHDGLAARLTGFEASADRLRLSMQPARWALRLLDNGGEAQSMTALCVVRDRDGRWLAGRRAAWLATWANKWALGAGGAVEVGEDPSETLARELDEEWQLTPERLSVEALVHLPSGLVSLVGLATVANGAEAVPDAEHDEFAWWPADVARWPDEADDWLRALGAGLAAAARG